MPDNSGAVGRPLSAYQSEETPTAPPIRPGIAVGVVTVENPVRIAPTALRALLSASAPRPSRSAIRIVPIAPRAPSVSRPSRAARVPVHIALTARHPRPRPSRCGYHGAMAGKNRAACIPFSPNARKKPPPWQYLREMHASRDQDGKILALCVRFRSQSGDSGYMARESCHQGPLFASRARKSCMARRCCQSCPAFRGGVSRAAGPRTGRTGLAPCALRPGLARLPHARASPPRLRQPRPTPVPRPSPPLPTLPPSSLSSHSAIRVPYRRKRAEPCSQLNAGIKNGIPKRGSYQ